MLSGRANICCPLFSRLPRLASQQGARRLTGGDEHQVRDDDDPDIEHGKAHDDTWVLDLKTFEVSSHQPPGFVQIRWFYGCLKGIFDCQASFREPRPAATT